MNVRLVVPSMLRSCCDGAPELSLPAASAQDVLDELARRYPSLYRSICNETGALRPHVGLFVNTTPVRERAALDAALAPGDVITVLPAVSGG